jgi:septum formation protein
MGNRGGCGMKGRMISSPKKTCQNKVMPDSRALLLASTSRYRKELLQRLGLRFACVDPQIVEDAPAGEAPAETARRLAAAKARAVAAHHVEALVIGADQVASCGALRFDKPGDHANAVRQLSAVSGKAVRFDTAVAVLDARSGALLERVVPSLVRFRALTPGQIEDYLRREQPYDCAGSAKVEGLGITLIAGIDSDDPTALIGLPLIALSELLLQAGMPVLRA